MGMTFVLGGTGFVGSAVCRALQKRNIPHQAINRTNYKEFLGQTCDLLVNANGNSSKILATRDPLADFDGSVRSVRQSLIDFRFKRYIFLSSCDVYPDCSSPATTSEAQKLDIDAQSPYGFHKYLAEQTVQHAAADWLIFRMGGFVGPGLKKNAIFDILQGTKLWLHPDSRLQFLHSDSLASIVLDLADSSVTKMVLNACGDGTVQLRDVMEWAKTDVAVSDGAPQVRYEIAIDNLRNLVTVPKTEQTVRSFVESYLREGTGAH